MYSPERKITGSNLYNLKNYIEGDDIYNSKFLYLFHNLPAKGIYTINRFEYRIDLISQDMYGSTDYSDLILFYNNVSTDDLTIGKFLSKFDLADLDRLILTLDD